MTARQPRCEAPGCDEPAHASQLCTDCADGLAEDLLAVRSLWAHLSITLSRQDRLAERGASSASQPLPWNEHASKARHRLADAVLAAGDLARTGHLGGTGDPSAGPYAAAAARDPDPVPLARWCWRWRDAMVLLPGIGRRAHDLYRALEHARRAIDRPEYDRQFLVGPCPRPGESQRYCPGEVWALIPTRESDPSVMRCRSCGHEWGTIRWLRAGREIRRRQAALGHLDQRVKGRQLISRATLLHVTGRAQSVITKHCTPVLVDPATRTQLYDAEIALDALAHVPTRRRSA